MNIMLINLDYYILMDDYDFSSAESGTSETIPMEAYRTYWL